MLFTVDTLYILTTQKKGKFPPAGSLPMYPPPSAVCLY